MRALSISLAVMAGTLAAQASAFCGFYVGKADASLFNEASQVVMTRHENKTVISMLNDYKGELKEFALVVPVPEVLKRGQVNVGDKKLFDRLDAYSSPRLAEYFDEDPCSLRRYKLEDRVAMSAAPAAASAGTGQRALGVTVEDSYTVGEYDIVILSAKESDGLETWLTQNGYNIPKGASRALKPYINQGLKFFVAKVNLKEQAKTGFQYLRPLQFAFEYERFMLPIRLGMINANGPQDLVLWILTKEGRVESTNYRTVKLPANMDLPTYIRGDFKTFYKAMFDQQAKKEDYKVVFTEYFWDMGWCDPCAADPLTNDELRKLGVFWIPPSNDVVGDATAPQPMARRPILPPGRPQQAMVTRLHIRYTPETFPEDLMFQQTKDRQNFQTRYVLRHPWKGNEDACPEAKNYFAQLRARQEKEATQLASLTGWNVSDIRAKMNIPKENTPAKAWWDGLWK